MSTSMDWDVAGMKNRARRTQASPLLYFLVFVFALFMGILIFCYVVTKRSNPVLLDGQGKPLATSSEHSHH